MSQGQASNASGDSYHFDVITDPPSNSSSPRSNRSISQTQTSSQSSSANSFGASHSNCLRSLSLVDNIEFKFDGNISKYALALGDCDNDEKNELVLGTLNGELLIYKNNSEHPQVSTRDLGTVACILVGDILNAGYNFIVSISVEGYLKIFQMYNDVQLNPNDAQTNVTTPTSATNNVRRHHKFSNPNAPLSNVKLPPTISDNEVYSSTTKLILVHYQQMQSNAMSALLVDFDNDGSNELLVALSDRVVRCYRTVQYNDGVKMVGLYKWELSDQIGSMTLHNWIDKSVLDSDAKTTNETDNKNDDEDANKMDNHKTSILVTQFGGIFAKITACCKVQSENGDHLNCEEIERTVQYCQAIPDIRNPQTSAEILSNIQSGNDNENLMAMATHDGTLVLVNDEQNKHTIRWCIQLEHPILSLTKHDMNNDGRDELFVCVWSGVVYILNLDGQFISCHFHEPISSFTAGHFHLNDRQVNCFVYTTFTNSVRLYYDIEKPYPISADPNNRGASNLIWQTIVDNHPEMKGSFHKILHERLKLDIEDDNELDNNDPKICTDLIRTLLYEIP